MVDDENISALLSSTVLILLGTVLSSISKLVERIVVARLFAQDAYGEVSLALAVLTIGTTVSLIGLNHGIPRYVGRYDDPRDIRGTWFVGLVGGLLTSLAIAGLVVFKIDLIADLLFEDADSSALLRLFAFAIPINVGVTVGVATLRGMENTRYKLYVKNLLHPGLRLGLIAALLATGYGLAAVGYAYIASGLVVLFVTHVLVNRLVDLIGPVRTHVRELVTYSAPLIVTMLLSVLLTRTDTLMLGYFKPSSVVGVYNAAYPLANSLLLIISAFGYLYLPLTSRLDAADERDEVSEIYRITTKWGYVVTFPAFLAFVVFADDVVSIFFGSEYAGGGIALAILSLGFFTSAALGRNRSTLSALGHTKHILAADVATIVTNIVLNLLLIPPMGFVGASIASASAFVVRNAAISAVLKYKCGITPFSRNLLKIYALLPLVLLPASYALSLVVSLSLVTLVAFLVVAGLACLVAIGAAGLLRPEDAIILDFLEDKAGVEVPFVRRHVPTEGESALSELD